MASKLKASSTIFSCWEKIKTSLVKAHFATKFTYFCCDCLKKFYFFRQFNVLESPASHEVDRRSSKQCFFNSIN